MSELIVALDVQTRAEAEAKVKLLGDAVDFYKIGLELFTAEGPDVVKAVKGFGKRVFLDLKFHDIPNTVAKAVKSGGKLGVDLMTIHAVGGRAMIAAARAAAGEYGAAAPKILAVTVLTSLDQSDLADIGVAGRTPADQVEAMARFAVANGANGLVCSAFDVGGLSPKLPAGTLFVTPGVRPAGAAVGDQKRIATPAVAVAGGVRSSPPPTPLPPPVPSAPRWTWRSEAVCGMILPKGDSTMTELEKKLTASAEAASREAVERAFAAGLSVTVLRDNRIVRVAPDGTETLVEVLTFDD